MGFYSLRHFNATYLGMLSIPLYGIALVITYKSRRYTHYAFYSLIWDSVEKLGIDPEEDELLSIPLYGILGLTKDYVEERRELTFYSLIWDCGKPVTLKELVEMAFLFPYMGFILMLVKEIRT